MSLKTRETTCMGKGCGDCTVCELRAALAKVTAELTATRGQLAEAARLIQANHWRYHNDDKIAEECRRHPCPFGAFLATLAQPAPMPALGVPCSVRCWRVGGPVTVASGEVCPECGNLAPAAAGPLVAPTPREWSVESHLGVKALSDAKHRADTMEADRDDAYSRGRDEERANCIEDVRAEARDCGCAMRIEARITNGDAP